MSRNIEWAKELVRGRYSYVGTPTGDVIWFHGPWQLGCVLKPHVRYVEGLVDDDLDPSKAIS